MSQVESRSRYPHVEEAFPAKCFDRHVTALASLVLVRKTR
jgi:hypothetical protein